MYSKFTFLLSLNWSISSTTTPFRSPDATNHTFNTYLINCIKLANRFGITVIIFTSKALWNIGSQYMYFKITPLVYSYVLSSNKQIQFMCLSWQRTRFVLNAWIWIRMIFAVDNNRISVPIIWHAIMLHLIRNSFVLTTQRHVIPTAVHFTVIRSRWCMFWS